MSLRKWIHLFSILLLGVIVLPYSVLPPGNPMESVRAYSRPLEFNYLSWSLNALWVKINQVALGTNRYLPNDTRRQLVLDYVELIRDIQQREAHLNAIYADPDIPDADAASAPLRQELGYLYAQRSLLGPLAESILQDQTSAVLAGLGITLGGQAIPPVLYHSTPLPTALIVSPRNAIRQDANISLVPAITADQRTEIEDTIDRDLDVSSLIVDIGGVGIYPTMVMQTSDLNFLTEVVAHEWIHNYFTLRPLGLYYLDSPEARTMNETAATIGGKEIGRLVMERYYPDLLPPPPPPEDGEPQPPPAFDFRAEMHLTRITVDSLLEQGKVEEAEAYMEQRRIVFWEHGYRHLRKLNQAYFAFYGAYADHPVGPAGRDPVGEAVRGLRALSPSLSSFLNRIAWMTSFEQLQRAVDELSS